MKRLLFLPVLLTLNAAADPGLKDRLADENAKGQVQWIYNDIAAGIAAAKKADKPLFVTFRCVPCADCMQFDRLVAGENTALKKLADKFIAVRQVEMKGVDLTKFQFDYDLNWAGMFLNADGTVYARYGTQSEEGADAYNSPGSLAKTMKRVLALHEGYPGNKSQLVGKQGKPGSAKTALDLPGLENKQKHRGPTARNNCIHCHTIYDAQVLHAWDTGKFSQEMLWRYPLPQSIGLVIDREDGRRIAGTIKGSRLEKTKLPPGAELSKVEGQVITSIADIQWALDQLPRDRKEVTVSMLSQGREVNMTLPLNKGWRKSDISWRASIFQLPPRLRIWFPPADEKEKRRHKLPVATDALVARWINSGELAGKAAQQAGLRTGDLVIEVDGKPVQKGHTEFLTYIKLNFKPGQKLPLTLWREGKKVSFELPLVK